MKVAGNEGERKEGKGKGNIENHHLLLCTCNLTVGYTEVAR